MERKIFKWTAALAVALTLAGGAAGLSPAPVNLSDYSITAEAASSYFVSNSTLYLWGTETYQPSKLPSGCSPESITGIILGDGANITFEERLVNYFPNLEEADFSKATVKGLSGLFSGISSLKNVSLYETNLNSFRELFAECYNLETVDLRIAAGQEVYFVDKMFHNCYNLTSIRWNSNFNTSSARSAEKMFCGCASLEYVDLSLLDLKRVSNTVSMFEDCYSLKELDLNCLNSSKIDFWNEDYWLRMFYHCNSLNKLSLPAGFRVQCTMGLPDSANNTSEDLKGWADSDDLYTAVTYDASISYGSTYRAAQQYSNVSFTEPFTLYRRGDWIDKGSCYYCDRVNYVLHLFGDVDRDEVYYMDGAKNVTEVWCEEGTVFPYNCNGLFMYCHKLKKADLNNADTSGVGNMSNMFRQCDSLEEINIGKIDTSNVYTMEYMFASCTSLKYFYNNSNGKRWNTKNVKYFNQMFAYCTSLREVRADFESNVITSVEGMFNNCGNLEMIILDENGFDLRGVADEKKANMFADCPNLTSLYLSSNFGGITQNMKLRNDGGGWCDATRNGIQVSGTAQYAEIDDRIAGLTIFHAEKFSVINLDQTFTVSDAPVVGFTNYGLEEGVTCNSTAFKIDKDLS
ncbi:MAG: BspA family leucine-rich repeat surface protein, partial [Oscillospiraceae bacterium]|nr:BspA family leucine-rich repeat surface protein [Oscillospiraceae bacterium]